MRVILFLFMIVFAYGTYAVGWEEIRHNELGEKGISIQAEFQKFSNCTAFEIGVPSKLGFEDLGNREFSSARYISMNEGTITFPLSGTVINVQAVHKDDHFEIKGMCISTKDLNQAYLAANYLGPPGSVPMVVYFKLAAQK